MLISPSRVILLLFCLLSALSRAQPSAIDPKEMASRLCIKNDVKSQSFLSVLHDLNQQDSLSICHAVTQMEKERPRHLHYRIQMLRLKINLAFNFHTCPEWPAVDDMLGQGLQLAYESNDLIMIAEMNHLMMSYYVRNQDYGSAGVYGFIARDMEEKAGFDNFTGNATLHFFLGYVTFHTRDYRSSITTSRQAIHWAQQHDPADTLGSTEKMNAWNTIGLCYEKLGVYDSAFLAFHEALIISKQLNNSFWTALIRGNQGDVYFKLGQYDSAKVLLQMDVEQSMATQQWYNAANSMQWLARIHASEGKAMEALKEAREADALLQKSPSPEFKANLLFTYTQVFKALHQADSMDIYMKKYLALHDSLEQVATDARAEIVRMRMDNQESVHRIVVLNKEKHQIALIRNLIILIILLAAITGYLFLHRERLKLRWRQQQAIQQKNKAEAEADSARQQLQVFTENLVEKTNLVEKLEARLLEQQLLSLPKEGETDLSHITLLTEEDWDQFKLLFERVYPGFFSQLKRAAPDITIAEQRMAALIKLNISARKAASILAISPNSVHKSRQRLRHRLGLETDSDLDAYFTGDSLSKH